MTLSMEQMAQLRTPAMRSASVHTVPASQGLPERLGFIRLSEYANSCIDSCRIVLIWDYYLLRYCVSMSKNSYPGRETETPSIPSVPKIPKLRSPLTFSRSHCKGHTKIPTHPVWNELGKSWERIGKFSPQNPPALISRRLDEKLFLSVKNTRKRRQETPCSVGWTGCCVGGD